MDEEYLTPYDGEGLTIEQIIKAREEYEFLSEAIDMMYEYAKEYSEANIDNHSKLKTDFLENKKMQKIGIKFVKIVFGENVNHITLDEAIKYQSYNPPKQIDEKIDTLYNSLHRDKQNNFDIINFDNVKKDDWLIDGVIPNDSFGEFYGETGNYKSFILLDMLFCIAHGLDWDDKKTEQGKVIYVAGEGRRSLGNRIQALEKKYDVKLNKNNFKLMKPYDLMDEEKMKEIGFFLAKKDNFQMMVIDTLRANAPYMNEKEDSHWSLAKHHLKTYIKPLVNVISWVHHPSKSDRSTSSGTQTRKNDSDFQFLISKTGHKASMKCTKMKDGEDGWKLEFELIKTLESLTIQPLNKAVKAELSEQGNKLFDKLTPTEQGIIKENNLFHVFTHDELKEAVNKSCSDKTAENRRKITSRIAKKYDLKV